MSSPRKLFRFPRLWFPLALGALCLSALPSPGKAADGRELLAHIGLTAVEKNYRGRKMIIDFSRMTPQVRKLSIMYELGGRERREHLDTNNIAVIDGDFFYQYFPSRKMMVRRKLPAEGGYDSLRKENLKQTLISYELKSAPSEPVAGRAARLYEFHPRHPGSRPVRKVWVDVETGLVLRMEVFSPDNKLFWLSVFENVDYKSRVSHESFTLKIPGGVKVVESEEGRCFSPDEAQHIAGLPLELPRYIPGGFVQKCMRARRAGGLREIQVLYSDGLSLLSLFASSKFRPSKSPGPGQTAVVEVRGIPGVLHQFGLVSALHWKSPGAYFTILGEISREELFKVAESVYPLRELSRH